MARLSSPEPETSMLLGGAQDHDVRDRLILALYAQLKAERETREALEYTIRNGGLSPEVLEAIAGDPIPAAVAADIAAVEKVIALDARRREAAARKAGATAGQPNPV